MAWSVLKIKHRTCGSKQPRHANTSVWPTSLTLQVDFHHQPCKNDIVRSTSTSFPLVPAVPSFPMSTLTHSQTELDSSLSSLRRPRKSKSSSSSEVSKVYKHTSQLYLTRRLAECYEALQPVIRPPSKPDQANGNHSASEDDSNPRAPIALASTSQRIKIWSLYAALLNVIIELGDEEGKRDFGSKQYREIVRNVQSGEVWEQVVRDGYAGRECSVDAEVVYNLCVSPTPFWYENSRTNYTTDPTCYYKKHKIKLSTKHDLRPTSHLRPLPV